MSSTKTILIILKKILERKKSAFNLYSNSHLSKQNLSVIEYQWEIKY